VFDDLWYKNAIIYCVNAATYMDGNGDGVGDFLGLKRRFDYLSGLGVTCLWLLPFYPSPGCDDGYDVTDYYGIHPRLGDLGDFVDFSHQAGSHRILGTGWDATGRGPPERVSTVRGEAAERREDPVPDGWGAAPRPFR
jgi:hypothetical protein